MNVFKFLNCTNGIKSRKVSDMFKHNKRKGEGWKNAST